MIEEGKSFSLELAVKLLLGVVSVCLAIIGTLTGGWMYWVSTVALEAGDKKEWMIKQQKQITINKENIIRLKKEE